MPLGNHEDEEIKVQQVPCQHQDDANLRQCEASSCGKDFFKPPPPPHPGPWQRSARALLSRSLGPGLGGFWRPPMTDSMDKECTGGGVTDSIAEDDDEEEEDWSCTTHCSLTGLPGCPPSWTRYCMLLKASHNACTFHNSRVLLVLGQQQAFAVKKNPLSNSL